jgi:autotransporter-associated beta strand protein
LNLIGNAAGSAESIGALTINGSPFRINVTDNTGGLGSNTLTFASVSIANSGSALDLLSIGGLGSLNKVLFTTSTGLGAVNGLLPKVYINGNSDFAAYDVTNGVVPFTAYNNSNNLDTAAATDTLNITGAVTQTANRTVNAIRLNGTGLNLGTAGRTITLTTGALISTGAGTNTIDGALAIGNQAHFQVAAGNTLDVVGSIIGANTFAKAGAGTMIFSNRQYFTSTLNVLNGTLKLDGGLNTIYAPAAGAFFTSAAGSTLDLNGNVQGINALTGPGAAPGGGGNVVNTHGTNTATLVGYTGGTFGGIVSGQINYARMGGGTQTLSNANTYSGWTVLGGGTTTLRDDATLLNTSDFDINFATLFLDNNANLQRGINNRINDAAPVTLRGGTITYNGVVGEIASERFGTLSVLMGANELRATTNYGSSAFASADLLFTGGLTRTPGSTINFTSNVQLGTGGNQTRILFDAPIPTVANGALGAWAIANTTDFAAYNSGNGIGVVGTGGYVGYSENFGSGNITNLGATSIAGENSTSLTAASTSTALLRLARQSYQELTFSNGTNILNLEEGGLLRENNAFAAIIGTPASRGVLTAGGTESSGLREMVFYSGTAGAPTFYAPNTGGVIALGSPNVTLSSTVGLLPGMNINHTSFPAGTTVVSVNGLTSVTLSNNATAAAQNTNLTTDTLRAGAATSGSPVVSVNSTVGVRPGMTLTGTGIPAGSYVVSVDSSTQLTLSQNATVTNSGQNFIAGMGNVIVNSVIADNGLGNQVQFIKSGAGVFNLSANNTYTGGTIVNQGTVNLIGSGVVIPAGGITLSGGSLVMNTNAGQIDASNAVTVNGSSVMTLVGANTLDSITFNNLGGTGTPTVTTGGILTLTSATPLSATSSNPVTFATVNGTLNLGTGGTRTIDTGAILHNGVLLTDSLPSLIVNAAIQGPGVAIDKTGAGLLQLGGQSSFSGGLNVQGGGIILSASSTSTVPNSMVTGPLGIGAVSFASGTSLFVDDNSRTVANEMTFAGNPTFSNRGANLRTLTLNGPLNFDTLATTGLLVNLPTPYLDVVLGGEIAGMSSVTAVGSGSGVNTINKTGLGNITGINLTGLSDTADLNISGLTSGTAFSLLLDGDGTGNLETLDLGDITWNPASGTVLSLTVSRAGGSTYFPTPANKTIAPASFTSTLLGNGLTLSNGAGYSLKLVDNIAFNTVSANQGPTFSVSAANSSLVIPGLVLDGQLTGGPTGGSATVLTKVGNGTLRLGNATNTFGGGGSAINITGGILEVAADGALGDASNIVRLSSNNAAHGLRISGTFATSREINLNAANTGIDVTQGNTFTLDSAFTFGAAANGLRKNDLGTLVLTQAQPGWDGIFLANQGVTRIENGAALGSTTGRTEIGNVGAVIELPGGVTIADPIFVRATNNATSAGIAGGGAIRSTSGTNTVSGAITIDTTTADNNMRAVTLTADSGATLNVTGGVIGGVGTGGANRHSWVGFGGAGTTNITTTGLTNTGTLGIYQLNKFGSGTLNIQVANAFSGRDVMVKQGTLSLNGAGALAGLGGGQTANRIIHLHDAGTLELDNSGTNVNNRLGTGATALNINGGDLRIIGSNSATTTETTTGVMTFNAGAAVITLDAGATQQLNFTTAAVTRNGGSTLLVRADNFGNAAGAGVGTIQGTGNGYTFIGQTGATSTANKSILPWAIGDTNIAGAGTNFVTADAAAAAANTGTARLRLLTGAEQVSNLSTANANVNLAASTGLSSSLVVNSLRLDGAGGGITMTNNSVLTLDSGGLLALSGNTGITGSGRITTGGNRELIAYTVGDLNLAVPLVGFNGGLTKSGDGMLTLGTGNTFTGAVTVNQGTLKLAASDFSLTPNQTMQLLAGQLDLNGTVQNFNNLQAQTGSLAVNDGFAPNTGGDVINTSGTEATLGLTTANTSFRGRIGNNNVGESNIAVVRSTAAGGTVDWNLYSDNTYTGATLLNGGRTQLIDGGRLSATSSIELSNSTLLVTTGNITTDPVSLTDRINDAASINLRGAMLQWRNRAALITTETLGAVTLGEGASFIEFAEGGTAVNQSDITFSSFAQTAGQKGTVRFVNVDGNLGGFQRLFINTLNGQATTSIGDGLNNDLIGGWATFEREFASYTPSMGVGAINGTGYAGYSSIVDPNIGSATDNVRIAIPAAGITTTLTGDRSLNSFNFQGATSSTGNSVLDLGGNTLALTSGGIILSNVTDGRTMNVQNGNITAGTLNVGGDLYVHGLTWFNNQADNTGNRDITLGANVVNNGSGAVSLIIEGNQGRGTLAATNDIFVTGANTHTGGTWVNSGRVVLNTAGADGTTTFAVPGNLTVSGGYGSNPGVFSDRNTQVIFGSAGQIGGTGVLTIKGGASVDFANFNQSLGGLIFDNHGGTTPTLNIGTGTLTLNGNLTATSQNLGAVSTISATGAGRIDLGGAVRTLEIGNVTWNGDLLSPTLATLNLNAPLTGSGASGINKTGAGTLTLTLANTYAGSTTVTNGVLKYGIANALPTGTAVTVGATGVLDLAGFSATVGSLAGVAGGVVTSSTTPGNVSLTTGGDNSSTTYAGVITQAAGATLNLVKTGTGTMTLTGANTYTGRTAIQNGAISVDSIGNVGAPSGPMGAPATPDNGAIYLGSGATTGTLIYTGAGEATDRMLYLDGTTGGGTFQNDGGLIILNSRIGAAAGAKTFSITSGALQLAAGRTGSAIADNVGINLADVAGVSLDLNGFGESFGSLSGGGASGGDVIHTTGSLILGYDNFNSAFAGAINGSSTGGLTKVGGGMQTFTGALTFTGNVLIQSGNATSGGGLILGGNAQLADTINVTNRGYNTTFGVNASDTIGTYSGTTNTILALGDGATLTSTYTNGTPTALAATADSAAANGRIIRQIDTTGLKPGDLISGTGVTAPGYIVQIIDATTVLVNRTPPTGPSNDFVPTVTSVSVLGSAMTGEGGFTKDGTGTLILTGNSSHSGATTINSGTVQVGGIWDGRKYVLHDTLSNNSRLVFAGTGTQTLQFADSTTNLLSFERVGSISGGAGSTTSILLQSGTNAAVLALGGDNSTSTFTGRFMGPGGADTMLIKEGTGNFTWSNGTGDVFDGPVYIDNGTFTIAGATGFDASNEVWMSNRGTTLNVTTTGGDTIPFLIGGAGSTRGAMPAAANGGTTSSGLVGATPGNFLTSVAPIVTLTTNLTVNEGTTANIYTFNGDFQGAGTLIKSGNHQMNLTGSSTNSHTGETQVTAGTLRMGVLSRSAGLGAASLSDVYGTLSTGTGLRLTGGVLDINGTSQTVTRINASSTGGTIALGNGSLTLSNQNTQTTATGITGNRNAVLNLNSSAPSTLTLTGGGSSTFAGTVNIGTNAALTLNGVNFGDLSRINLNGTGTQLTVTVGDNIGSVAGTGSIVLTGSLGLLQAESGASSAPVFSGATSGAGALNLSNFGGLTVSGNLAHTGGTGLSNGSTLTLAYGAGNNIMPTTGALTLNGGTLRVSSSASSPAILESVASLSLNAGASSFETVSGPSGNFASGNAGLGLGAITRAAGGTVNFGRQSASTTTTNLASGILGAYATFDGRTWAVGNGGTTAISGLGTFSPDAFGAGLNVDITAGGANAGGAAETLRFSGASAADITGATTLSTGGILVTPSVGANTSTISGALGATGNELIIHQNNMLGDLVLSNVGGTNTAITTSGGGRTLITNNIAGTGATTVGYGYLQLGDNTVGGSAAGMVGSGTIRLDGTLGVNRSNAVSLGGIISGAGNLEQRGTGTTTLSAANTYLGRTSVLGGTLEVTNNNGLGGTNFGLPNRWANLTSVNTGGTLRVNVTAGGTITELLNLGGGTLDLRSTVATTLNAPIVLSGSSTIRVSNPGAAVSHLITGEILALPGSNLTIGGVVNATPSTLVLAPANTPGARWENTTIEANGRLQIGNNTRGWIGSGDIVNDGTLITNTNNGHLVLANNLSGGGSFIQARNTVYLTGDNSGYTGNWTVGSVAIANAGAELRVGNDTYTGSLGSGDVTVQATAGSSLFRTHFIGDTTLANNITLNANSTLNAHYLRQGVGNVSLTGNLTIGANSASTGRAILQTEGSGILSFDGTLVGGSATNLLNISNNGIFRFGGSASHSYHGVLSGNNVWLFDNSGNTTLLGVNTFNTVSTYLRKGTVTIGTGGVDTIQNDNDMHVLNGATLSVAGNETIGQLYMQRGAITTIASGATLTVDDAGSQMIAGSIQGDGNLTLLGGNGMAMYGTNTATGALSVTNGVLILKNVENAIGSFGTVTLGGGTTGGRIDYTGSGEAYNGDITLAGTGSALTAVGSNRISANGNGALVLSGNINAIATNTLQLTGQTGGYFNPIKNVVSGAITQSGGILTLAVNPKVSDDDRYGVTGRWALTNAANNFSGNIIVNTGMLEIGGALGAGGAVATSQMGALNVARTIDLGTQDANGRRYDMFGNTDQIGAAGAGQGTNTVTPNSGSVGTLIFNSTDGATFTVPSNITFTQSHNSATNPGAGQIINDGLGAVVIQGALTTAATGNRSWILDGTNTGINTISGNIANGPTVSLLKEGAGTWRLSGTNTYAGATTINNGILEVTGGSAILDAGTVALSADGGDGLFSGVAKFSVLSSETIGLLTGDVLTETEIASGQTLTIGAAGANVMSGLITGAGSLVRTTTAAAASMNSTARNTYTGSTTISATGAASGSTQLNVWHLADGGAASGIGQSSNAASNLVFGTVGTFGGVLNWTGYTNQSTDRLFTMGLGAAGARINASGTVIGTSTAPTLTFSNTNPIAFTGSGARTLILGGGTISDNTFRPQITDGGGATTLSKVDGGLWLVNPLAGNSYTGGTSITGGTLAIQAGNALGGGTITINGGAGTGLQLRSVGTLANNITNSTAEGGMHVLSGTNLLTGAVAVNTNFRLAVDAGASVEFSNAAAALSGAGSFIKFGNGTAILSGVNTNTGTTNARNGVLQLEYGTNNTSKLADGAALAFGGHTGLTATGVDANVAGNAQLIGSGGGTIHLNGGSHTEIVSATTIDTGSNAVTRGSGTSVLRMNVITRNNSGGTIDFGAAGIAQSDNNNVNGILGGWATVGKTNWATTVASGAADTAVNAL